MDNLQLKPGEVIYKCPKCCSIKPERAHHCRYAIVFFKAVMHIESWTNVPNIYVLIFFPQISSFKFIHCGVFYNYNILWPKMNVVEGKEARDLRVFKSNHTVVS